MSRWDETTVRELSALLGIESHYYDIWGNRHEASNDTMAAALRGMGVDDPGASLRELKRRPWSRFIEPVLVVSVNEQPRSIPVYFPLAEGDEGLVSLRLSVTDEHGNTEHSDLSGVRAEESSLIDGRRYVKAEVPNRTERPLGYYTLDVTCQGPGLDISGSMRLIIAPERCHLPREKTWGIYMNLYALRSESNWGCGDLGDLADFVSWADGELGAGFVGINPLHAIGNRMPFDISPYSSSSRLYRNHIYLDMDEILLQSEEGRALLADQDYQGEIEALRAGDLIDYESVSALKLRALRVAFSAFCTAHVEAGTRQAEDLARYIEAEGHPLESYAIFMALDEQCRRQHPETCKWQEWPAEYRDPRSPAVEKFKREHSSDILFYQYVQWLIDRQLRETNERARGMPVGLYGDLAVGSSGEGSDAWSHPEVFAPGIAAGAPPDSFNLNGQNWGFPPLVPGKLQETGYELFIKTIRQNVAHSGAIRIDHALGLFRLFWIPHGMPPQQGTYVRYPHEDLLRIIALESVRSKAIIISEDLGTVGEEVREELYRFGMLSYRLLYFERQWPERTFLPPGAYPEMALTAVTTHDLPTLYGYWLGRDIDVKTELDLYPGEEARINDVETRKTDKLLMLEALKAQIDPDMSTEASSVPEMTSDLLLKIYIFLARTPCLLASVSLDDVLGVLNQQNMPGVLDEHPNWRQKTPVDIRSIFKDRRFRELASMFKAEGRGRQARR